MRLRASPLYSLGGGPLGPAREGSLGPGLLVLSSQRCFLGQAVADAEGLVEKLRVAAEEAEEKLSLARLKLREQMQEGQ